MRRVVYVACFAMIACALLSVIASGKTNVDATAILTITHVHTYDQPWFIESESSVQDFHELRWKPAKAANEEDPYPYKDFSGPALASESQMVQRKISWRMDNGQIENINWKKVRQQLWAKFNIHIGATIDVLVPAVTPVECYCVCGSGYAAYSRDVYRIEQDGNTVMVSILRPIDGVAVDYESCVCLDEFPPCIGSPPPESMQGTCASATSQPFSSGNSVGSGSKREVHQEPLLAGDDSTAPSTWGLIKELYRDE